MKVSNKSNQKYDPIRAAAVEAMILIEQGEQTDEAFLQVTKDMQLRPLDKRFMLQLINGATKMRRRLDHEIKFYLSRPSRELPIKLSNILRAGFYQLRFTDRIPNAAAVSESVNLAHYMTDRPRANLVNAVMRAAIREPAKVVFADRDKEPNKFLGDYYSFPDYFVKYALAEFGFDATEKLMQTFNSPPHVTYRVNFLKAKPDEVANLLQQHNIEFSYGRHLPEFIHIEQGGLPLQRELIDTGKVFVQDESAGLPVRLLNPRPKDNVLDIAAAPGGKSTYAAIRMRNRGRVTAIDKSRRRLKLIEENSNRLGIHIIAPVHADVEEFTGGKFDRVLMDPPCTGWGTAGKHSDLRWSKTIKDIESLSVIQGKMLRAAAKCVKPGGVLVYSTCTIIRQENDQVVEEFLLKHKDFEIDHSSQYYDESLTTERGFVKTYPALGHMDGAFCARLIRKNIP